MILMATTTRCSSKPKMNSFPILKISVLSAALVADWPRQDFDEPAHFSAESFAAKSIYDADIYLPKSRLVWKMNNNYSDIH